ncbi:hypothetical protein HGRIS_010679 [Hohenbuehelia grisea]|uniref:F-box domain-containing protein n=1 Tax=Hohenbuehelia grisea TaxID=104357 RepID=A0ABR3IXY2_9AGAR
MAVRQRLRLQSLTSRDRGEVLLPTEKGFASKAGSGRGGGIVRHVSNFLGSNKGKVAKSEIGPPVPPKYAPVENIVKKSYEYSPTSSTYSGSMDDDIRTPIGLGIPEIRQTRSVPVSPATVRSFEIAPPPPPRKSADDRDSSPRPSITHRPTKLRRSDTIKTFPQEVLNLIISHVPRQFIPPLALVSSRFCAAARATLYSTVDVRFIRSSRFDQLCLVLATHPELAVLVETFTYHTWHPAFFSRSHNAPSRTRDTQISLLTPTAATFARALENMQRMKYLTLPSFNVGIMQSISSSELKGVTFLNRTFSHRDRHELLVWLFTQPNLQSLSFPSLFDKSGADTPNFGDTPSNPSTPLSTPALESHPGPSTGTPSLLPSDSPFAGHPSPSPAACQGLAPPSPVPSTVASLASLQQLSNEPLLPALQTLHAPPSMATHILAVSSRQTLLPTPPHSTSSLSIDASVQPLDTVTVRVDSTIYTGLRPSALMQALASRGMRRLTLRFCDATDRRTLDKVVSAVGSVLGQTTGRVRGADAALEVLEIEVVKTGVWTDDELLNKIISSSISRFRALTTLRLRYATQARRVQTSILASSSADSLPLSTRSMPTKFFSHPSAPTIVIPSDLGGDEEGSPTLGLTDSDQSLVAQWVRQCPSLRTVALLSGAEWRRDDRRSRLQCGPIVGTYICKTDVTTRIRTHTYMLQGYRN